MKRVAVELLLAVAIFVVVRFGLAALGVDATVAALLGIVVASAFGFSTGYGRQAMRRRGTRSGRRAA